MSFYKTQIYMNVRHIELKYLVCLIFSCTRVILVWKTNVGERIKNIFEPGGEII